MIEHRFMREPECLKLTGLSRTTRWRLEKVGKFPKRIKISQASIGWVEEDIHKWMEDRIKSS
jgi:prophage regulatory protein